jgi:hypothetical protein
VRKREELTRGDGEGGRRGIRKKREEDGDGEKEEEIF